MPPRKSDHYYDAITTSSADVVRAYRDSIENDDSNVTLAVVSYRGGQTEFDLGRQYALSSDPLDRATGAAVLAQLGWSDQTFREESIELLLGLINDSDERVLMAAAYALGHRKAERGIPFVLTLVDYPNAKVRQAAVSGLTGLDDPSAIQGLIRLAGDRVPKVRDWAAFGLGTMIDTDTPEIREALFRLLDDPDPEIRGEALIGLAKRHDPRVLQPLIRELRGEFEGSWCLEAAELLGDPQLLVLLIRLRDSVIFEDAIKFRSDFERAISACSK